MAVPDKEKSSCLPVDVLCGSLMNAEPLVLYDLLAMLCSVLEGRKLITHETGQYMEELMRGSSLYAAIPREALLQRKKEADAVIERIERERGEDAGKQG